jgi:REP-associated tyrosine transposase
MQLALALPKPKQSRGGRRTGAGRKRISDRKRTNHDTDHQTRPEHPRRFPVHVTLRVKDDVKRLRRGYVLRKLRRALVVVAKRENVFRVVHMSIQANHLHLIVEAEHKEALARGMQSFAISAARAINKAQKRTGKVFAYRYFSREVRNRRQTRHALAYVLSNWRRHEEDKRSGRRAARALLDPYSSAVLFDGWTCRFALPDDHVPLAVKPARTWLLYEGWKMYGMIEPREVPGRL